ncbi:hypothetical protein Taro_035571 [Colocasia esculenta]|uniref:Uncharacterized protein n=1 Tax=Colocasia esculenta TaxID=4460 RepID=A0A843WJ07_COLES|nr:hypothetical protein [Colocasia esculenta]
MNLEGCYTVSRLAMLVPPVILPEASPLQLLRELVFMPDCQVEMLNIKLMVPRIMFPWICTIHMSRETFSVQKPTYGIPPWVSIEVRHANDSEGSSTHIATMAIDKRVVWLQRRVRSSATWARYLRRNAKKKQSRLSVKIKKLQHARASSKKRRRLRSRSKLCKRHVDLNIMATSDLDLSILLTLVNLVPRGGTRSLSPGLVPHPSPPTPSGSFDLHLPLPPEPPDHSLGTQDRSRLCSLFLEASPKSSREFLSLIGCDKHLFYLDDHFLVHSASSPLHFISLHSALLLLRSLAMRASRTSNMIGEGYNHKEKSLEAQLTRSHRSGHRGGVVLPLASLSLSYHL